MALKAKDLIEIEHECKDAWDGNISPHNRDLILKIMALYHLRNGRKHPDGSLGHIKISPKQFRDALSYVVLELTG